jgi:hypothetical protein
MPRVSERQKLLNEVDSLLETMILYGDEKSKDFSQLMEVKVALSTFRFLNLRKHLAKNRSMNEMFLQYGHRDFKQVARMDKRSFERLVEMISGDPIFQSDNRKKQAPVWIQLMVVLTRLGCYGNGVSVGRIGVTCGFSYGSVCHFTRRVFQAILKLRKQAIRWPDADERKEISARMERKYGLGGAVMSMDGTPVVLSQKPGIDGEVYWTRKCHYALNLQLFCDDLMRIRHYIVGWPGSVFDNYIFEQSTVCKNPRRFLSLGEFILADAGYALREFVLTPYRLPTAALPHNKLFNETQSSARVTIEHTNGVVKGRWQSLKGIRTQLKNKRELKMVCDHIVVCLILHNLLIDFRDEWENDNEMEEVDDVDEEEIRRRTDTANGNELRTRVQIHVLRKRLGLL